MAERRADGERCERAGKRNRDAALTHVRELLQVNLHASLEHHEHQAELPEHDEGIGFGRDLQAVGTHRDAGEDLADELRE